ncbi:MAG: polyamine ABC transporter ATP-binding protein [Planctomycetes bacterium UTPLA1]|nr:MAG: polyamine ABC transporter ATP-binding protein [Planctomycetes bacterium UTPLA1]
MPRVSLDRVSRRFGGAAAVDNISLDVRHGEFVTLLGPSGCGKTTTLRMVAGLEQNDGGRISIGDRLVSDPAAKVFVPPDRRRLGMVFQSYAIWPHMTVFDNVAYPLRVRRTPAATINNRVMAALRLVEMESYARRPSPALSGGQQQRVAIARAIVFEPEVMLLDEPLSNLDAKLRAQMGDEFRMLQKRLGITTLYVTHDQEEAMALSDRIAVMQSGRLLQVGTPEVIYQRPTSAPVALFFGAPNMLNALVEACVPTGIGTFRLAVKGEDWRGQCIAGEHFDPGSRVVVMVRPENVALADPDTTHGDNEMAWPGRVIECVFRGARLSLTVEVSGRRYNVDAPAMRAASVGDNVVLRVDAEHAWALCSSSQKQDWEGRIEKPQCEVGVTQVRTEAIGASSL